MCNNIKKVNGDRIEYIDAMRGFTMLLVVCSHVETFMVGSPLKSINALLGEFQMPLFFFVSGFVAYKNNLLYGINEIKTLFKKKIFVLVLSPLLFMFLYCYIKNHDFVRSLFLIDKAGYWFTFVLFELFIINFLMGILMSHIRLKDNIKDVLWIIFGFVIYLVSAVDHTNLNINVSGLFAVEKLRYMLFFIIGTQIRKNWTKVETILDSRYGVAILVVMFAGLNFFSDIFCQIPFGMNMLVLFTALSGVLLALAFFRHYADDFSSSTKIGRVMQYAGRRTLDIYLIHYFLIEPYKDYGIIDFTNTNFYFLQYIVCLCVGIIIMTASLLVSKVLRTSPVLGHYLFGAKL